MFSFIVHTKDSIFIWLTSIWQSTEWNDKVNQNYFQPLCRCVCFSSLNRLGKRVHIIDRAKDVAIQNRVQKFKEQLIQYIWITGRFFFLSLSAFFSPSSSLSCQAWAQYFAFSMRLMEIPRFYKMWFVWNRINHICMLWQMLGHSMSPWALWIAYEASSLCKSINFTVAADGINCAAYPCILLGPKTFIWSLHSFVWLDTGYRASLFVHNRVTCTANNTHARAHAHACNK